MWQLERSRDQNPPPAPPRRGDKRLRHTRGVGGGPRTASSAPWCPGPSVRHALPLPPGRTPGTGLPGPAPTHLLQAVREAG